MMKSYNKRIVLAVMTSLLISPVFAFAETNVKNQNNFCANVDSVAQRINEQMTKKSENLLNKQNGRFDKITENRKGHDEKLDSKRDENQIRRDNKIDALMQRADTDVKKAAVNKFNSEVKTAINSRQSAIDTAIKNYRDGVDSLLKNKFSMIDSNYTQLKSSVDLAISTAKTSCANGADPKTVRATMQSSIKTAHEKYRSTRVDKAQSEIKTELKTLMDTRNLAIKKAQDDFKTVVEKARVELKTAFGIK